MSGLGWETLIALRIIRDTPNKEASEIMKESDCSFMELYAMDSIKLINMGSCRLEPRACHPIITEKGIEVINQAEKDSVI